MALIVVLFSVATLCIGILVPVYSDEVVMSWARGRLFAEGGNLVSLFPQCGESFVSSTPLLLWPAAALYSLVFGNLSPFGIRLIGVVLGFLWFGGLAYLCSRTFQQRKDALTWFGAMCAVGFLGVLPFVWVLARTENVLILCLLVLTSLAIVSRPCSRSYIKALAIVVTSALMFYVHPKALFFLPFVVIAACFVLRGANSILKYAVPLVIVAMAAQSVITARFQMQCTDAPQVKLAFSHSVLPLSLLFDSPVAFFKSGLSNVFSMPSRVVQHLLFANTYQSGWLPPMQTSELVGFVNSFIEWIAKLVITGAVCGGLLKFSVGGLRRYITTSGWLAMGLSVGLIANAFLYNAWHFYGAQQVIAIALVIGLLIFSDVMLLPSVLTMIRGLGVLLMATALVSLTILNSKMVPELYRSATSERYPPPNQPLSVPHLNQEQHFETIRALAKQCGFPASGAKNLVVDHMTYFAFSGLRQPIHIAYVSEYAYGGDLINGKLVPFLKQLGSSGAIGSCTYMSPQFHSLPQAELNGYCCVAFDEGLRGDQVSRRGLEN
ncbi:MAG TPA: hypothetical protein DCQ94_04830 [Nitrospira sp.]|nr:hypothetical protein [Nitrospira sp.]